MQMFQRCHWLSFLRMSIRHHRKACTKCLEKVTQHFLCWTKRFMIHWGIPTPIFLMIIRMESWLLLCALRKIFESGVAKCPCARACQKRATRDTQTWRQKPCGRALQTLMLSGFHYRRFRQVNHLQPHWKSSNANRQPFLAWQKTKTIKPSPNTHSFKWKTTVSVWCSGRLAVGTYVRRSSRLAKTSAWLVISLLGLSQMD